MKLLTVLLFISINAWSMPKHLEVWFLGIDQQASLTKENLYAQSGLQCQQVGEYCFDPHVGLYKKTDEVFKNFDHSIVENNQKYDFLEPPKSVDRNLITCEKGNLFDIFCGEAKKKSVSTAKLEVWIDTSSTMKQIDQGKSTTSCKRKYFAEHMALACPKLGKVKYYSFKENKKEISNFNYLCDNSGLNSTKNLIRDIKASKVERLIVITDIFEAFEDLVHFVEMNGGIIKGMDKPMYAHQMKDEIKRISKSCL